MIPYFNKHLLDSSIKLKKSKDEHNQLLEEYLRKIIQNSTKIKLDKRILKNINCEEDYDKI